MSRTSTTLDDAPRLVYRSRFIFLLLIAAANLGLAGSATRTWPARLASTIILIAPSRSQPPSCSTLQRGAHGSVLSGYTLRAVFVAALFLAFANRKARE